MSRSQGQPLRHCPYCGRLIGGLVCSDHADLPNLDPHLSRPNVNAKPVGVQPFATSNGSGRFDG